jgi:hypothetical protein
MALSDLVTLRADPRAVWEEVVRLLYGPGYVPSEKDAYDLKCDYLVYEELGRSRTLTVSVVDLGGDEVAVEARVTRFDSDVLGGRLKRRLLRPLLQALGEKFPVVPPAPAGGRLWRRLRLWWYRLDDPDPAVQKEAARELGKLADVGVVPRLCAALKAGGPEEQLVAADVLGGLGDRRAVRPLARALVTAPTEEFRNASARALRALGVTVRDPIVLESLAAALRSADGRARRWATDSLLGIAGLGGLGGPATAPGGRGGEVEAQALRLLAEQVSSLDPAVRTGAARALALIGDARHVRPLMDSIAYDDGAVLEVEEALLHILRRDSRSCTADDLVALTCLGPRQSTRQVYDATVGGYREEVVGSTDFREVAGLAKQELARRKG